MCLKLPVCRLERKSNSYDDDNDGLVFRAGNFIMMNDLTLLRSSYEGERDFLFERGLWLGLIGINSSNW